MELLERRINLLERRIADLEVQVQSQQENKIDVDEVVNKLDSQLKEEKTIYNELINLPKGSLVNR